MAQKVMINGTYYDLKPSPVLIDGTKYQIGGQNACKRHKSIKEMNK